MVWMLRATVRMRTGGEGDALAREGERAVKHVGPEGDPEVGEEVVEGGHVGAPCGGRPPRARVVVKEAHLHHRVHVVPFRKHHQRQALV
eukprot:3625650-Pyramimonas_sp.AAC.1